MAADGSRATCDEGPQNAGSQPTEAVHFPDIASLASTTKLKLSGTKLFHLPPEIGHLTALVDLDLGRTELHCVPPEIGQLAGLKFLNLMCNNLTSLPDSICQLTSLYRLGLKSNKIARLPDNMGNMAELVEVFLTDNCLKELPESLSRCTKLVKLQASRNELESLPESLGGAPNLELMRVAVNNITSIPETYASCPKLAWFSLAGNPVCPNGASPARDIPVISYSDLGIDEKLGDGASGDVFQVLWRGKQYAFKQFKSDDASPDGQACDEIAVKVYVQHPSLTEVVARVLEPNGVVMHLVHGKPMAEKPNFESLLRCRWTPNISFPVRWAMRAALDTASALLYLHDNNIAHGDVYAHNMLADETGATVLCDYGASFFYPAMQQHIWEAMEVLAWGRFLRDVTDRLQIPNSQEEQKCLDTLQELSEVCLIEASQSRPTFGEVVDLLAGSCSSLGIDPFANKSLTTPGPDLAVAGVALDAQ